MPGASTGQSERRADGLPAASRHRQTLVNRGVFQDFFRRICGTDEFRHTVSGFDFQGKVEGRGPIVFQDVGRKVVVFDPQTEEETIVSQVGHDTLPDGPEAGAVFRAAVA